LKRVRKIGYGPVSCTALDHRCCNDIRHFYRELYYYPASPGDFLSTYIADLREMGERVPEEQITAARERYGLEQPVYIQYAKWMRAIILHGDFGQSMQLGVPVKRLIGRELGYTVLVGLASILYVWVVAIPIGFSRQRTSTHFSITCSRF